MIVTTLCTSFAQSSVLSSGSWFKVAVEKPGVYKLTAQEFKNIGFDLQSINPNHIQIFGNGGGMLPQPNSAPRSTDLTQLAIQVVGGEDLTFDGADFVLFYAQGPDFVQWDATRNVFLYESNLYSDENYYFITIGETEGLRLANAEDVGSGYVINYFDDYVYHEVDSYNHLKSGRQWFGEVFDASGGLQQNFKFNVSGILEGAEIKLISNVMAQSAAETSFKVYYNNSLVTEQFVAPIPQSQYGVKGRQKRDTVSFISTNVDAPARAVQEVLYQYTGGQGVSTRGFLDFFLVNFKRKLALYNDQTIFRSPNTIKEPIVEYHVKGVNSRCAVWDVSDPYKPKLQNFRLQDEMLSFGSTGEELKEFVVLNEKVGKPRLVGKVPNQDLRGQATPNHIIVTHPDFYSEASRLANHRQANNNLSVNVVTTDQIYNEFSSGRQDITAIRDYVKYLYDKNPGVLRSLLLFGKSSYDYKDRVARNTNYVPTYESRNSLSPLETYSSDDYFGFLENDEGLWSEGILESNDSLDIGVGRLPVKTAEEAKRVVDKLINYDVNKKTLGKWRKEIVFVADDGSQTDGFTTLHQSDANSLAETIKFNNPEYDTRKIFLGTYVKNVAPNGETVPEARKEILSNFDRGALIINYTGHGNEEQWADEKILSTTDINELDNKLYPLLVTATCEFGRHDDPLYISGAELSVLNRNGGSIGLVTTARPVNAYTNYKLNSAFYQAMFEQENYRNVSLGEIFRQTKNNSSSGVSNRNFALLADPSLTLAMPDLSILVSEIKTSTGSDTLKALSKITVKGYVQKPDGAIAEDFNGTLEATLFDKQTEFKTIGKNNPAFNFKEWHNGLFRGKATVRKGEFEFSFIIPKNISYNIDFGKLSLYASDPSNDKDATGSSTNFKIGGSETEPVKDSTPPTIKLFMGDTTFVSGGVISSNTTLIAAIKDLSGINISNYGIGNTMVGVLDGDQTFTLNEYYTSLTDDYTKGWIRYPLEDLAPGKHTLTVKVWDTYNNGSESSIDFIVSEGEFIQIETFGNFPNPFESITTIFFTHNRPGDDLEANLYLYTIAGEQIKAYNFMLPLSSYQVNLVEVNGLADFGKKLPSGIYLARLIVRSLTNGSKNEKLTKLIMVN